MRYILHPVAYTIWLLALGISVALAWQFHGGDNTVALAIALLALGLSAFGVIFARDALQRHDWFAALCGIVLWAAGAVFFTITEIGYWDSSYTRHYTEYQQVKTAKARADGLSDKRWNALTTGDIPATPAQIKAQIAIATVNERWTSTKGCADVTTVPSREFCTAYFKLQSQLAVAEERVAMEQQFAREIAEKEGHIVQNLLAGAEVLARRLDITDRQAADLVIFAAWALLFLARDLGGVVANPLGRRKPQEAAKAPEATSAAPVVAPPTPRPRVDALTKIAGVSAGETIDTNDPAKVLAHLLETDWPKDAQADKDIGLLIGANSPNFDPDGPGTPMSPASDIEQMPSEGDIEPAAEKVIHAENRFRDINPTSEWKIKRSQADTKDFVRECLDTDQDALRAMKTAIKERRALDKHVGARLASLPDVYDIYTTWCASGHLAPKGQKAFSGELWSHLGLPKGTRKMKGVKGIRAASGLRFPVYAKQAERRYATA